MSTSPHQQQPVLSSGAPTDRATAAMIVVHGRGASAESMLPLADEVLANETDSPGIAIRAPQAANFAWYPNSFLAPLDANEPYLTSALDAVHAVVMSLGQEGIPPERTVLLGFSQGACLVTEYAARHPRTYGGVVAFSGGLIGSGSQDGRPPEDKTFDYSGDMNSTPVFLGCSDRDPHIPVRRVDQSAEVFQRLGADVTRRIYQDMGHTVNEDEIEHARMVVSNLTEATPTSSRETSHDGQEEVE